MKNVLKKFETNDVNFFVAKSYVTVKFDYDRQKPEYSIFYIKKNSSPEAYHEGYTNLKVRKMNRKELAYFKDNIDQYDEITIGHKGVEFSKYGSVFHLRSKPFDKSQCPRSKQLSFNL